MTDEIAKKLDEIRELIDVDFQKGVREVRNFLSDHTFDYETIKASVKLQRRYSLGLEETKLQQLKSEAKYLLKDTLKELETKNTEFSKREKFVRRVRNRNIFREHVVETKGLGFQYKANRRSKNKKDGFKLSEISFKLRQGEITSVVGKNAYGKSTLFKILNGQLKPSEGVLDFPLFSNGKKHNKLDWRNIKSNIAFVPQTLKPWSGSLEDNIRYQASIKGIRGRDNDLEFDYIVERLGLSRFLGSNWHDLSSGYKLRFELAKALIWNPKLLILDEPLANLDYEAQVIVLRDLQAFAGSFSNPKSVILSTQHLHEVESISDWILFLEEGKQQKFCRNIQLGKDRRYNAYEFATNLPLDLDGLTSLSQVKYVRDNHINFVVVTGRDYSRQDCIRMLNDQNIDFHYFRDISKSIKYLMEGYDKIPC